ncbi:MAG: DPP IV N-terminal domain-containing protein [Sedimentisphaerales bacterium]|nr:DPP IV N-terminal domain-containing protein [Sedimentisphaerales bacterium]
MRRTAFSPVVLIVAIVAVWGLAGLTVLAQGTQADYDRAMSLRDATANKVYKERVTPHWMEDNVRFWYRNDLADGKREFVLVNAEACTRKPAFDHDRLAAALGQATGQEVQADELPIDRLEINGSGTLVFSSQGKWWTCDPNSYEVTETPSDEAPVVTLEASGRARPSTQTGAETSITFINRTEGDIEIYWIDTEGQRQQYATVAAGERHQQHTYAGHSWLVTDSEDRTLGAFVATETPADAVLDENTLRGGRRGGGMRGAGMRRGGALRPESRGRSPDGKWAASVRDNNLYVRNTETDEETALTSDGTEADAYSQRFFWSPDSTKLVVLRTQPGDDRQVYLIESSPEDQLQPKLHQFRYLKPGDKVEISKPHLFDLATKCHIAVDDELFSNPYQLSDVRWRPDSSRFTFYYNERGHQVLRIVSVDAATGEAQAIIDEQSATFIDYSGKRFIQYLDDTQEMIWMSERDGWNHLYLYDAETGKVKNQITKGQWVVRNVDRVDVENRQVWFQAGGIRPEQDPYYLHFCRVNFDGSGLVVLTEGDGTHEIDFSPDRRFFIDRWSRVDMPPVSELRCAEDGKLICELECADWSALTATGWRPPERFVAKARDGKTDIYGIIIRPTTFDPAVKYSVIEQIYAGPQGAFVPKPFGLLPRQYAIAELGFIVVQMDGMGTSYRSKAFHDVCWKNLGDAGFPDRILWMKAAAARYPYMDLTRVGIYGGSAGGQNALRGLLAHGDFYKVGVADCGCHDNRMDKIWWNEQWMGWPIGPHYEEQSNVTQAHKLQGKLLLTLGELDRNVDPASTMQVVNALIKADKDFDLLIFPGGGHGSGETPYGSRRRMDFFVRHLLGVEPRCTP